MSTQDKLQDVFPITFQFVQGEQPTATKFTGWIKQTDTAFSNIGSAIGDPWEYQSHIHPLSPEKLAQTSLARFSGPSDWVSPAGSSWSQTVEQDIEVFLDANKTTWSLGFPLVKTTSTIGTASRISDCITPLVFNTDFAVVTGGSLFTTEKSDPADITATGDFHINYYSGVITIYSSSASSAKLEIYASKFNMFGPGVPWGTSNVIPHWGQAEICTVTEPLAAVGGISTYVVTFPSVTVTTRDGSDRWLKGALESYSSGAYGDVSDVYYSLYAPGHYAKYRMPYSTTSAFSSGERIPDGYMYLWSEDEGRTIPNTTFWYLDENSVQVTAPEGGVPLGMKVRVFVTGTSLAETSSYLMTATRYNRHVGLTDSQDSRTIMYTTPLSHDHLTERYTGNLPTTTTDVEKFQFRESSYPINPHPQYIHRAGWMGDDSQGNSGNAMRGSLVFAGTDTGFPLGQDGDDSGCAVSTYGVYWGGPTDVYSASLTFEGGVDTTPASAGSIANRIGFGIHETGALQGTGTEYYGALAYTPYQGTPLYVRGGSPVGDADYYGGVLGFDLGRNMELNYIKLLAGDRDGTYDFANLPANVGQASFATPLDITPSLSSRLAAAQIREFRFRGGAYLSSATNTTDSLGGTNTQGVGNEIAEFTYYYTSPGVVGADFLNVYSNAIFFSEEGDGQETSFTSLGPAWLNSASSHPTGIYYEPPQGGDGGAFLLYLKTSGGSQLNTVKLGTDDVSIYSLDTLALLSLGNMALVSTNGDFSIIGAESVTITSADRMDLVSSAQITLDSVADIFLDADDDIRLSADRMDLVSSAQITLDSVADIFLDADDDIRLSADDDITIYAVDNVAINADDTIQLASGNKINLVPGGHLFCQDVYTNNLVIASRDVGVTSTGMFGYVISSKKYKTQIKSFDQVDWLYKLNPVKFKWKADLGGEFDYGLIAEEVEEVNPELCLYDKEKKGKKSLQAVAYKKLTAPLLKAVQDHKQEIDSHDKEIENLKKEIEELKDEAYWLKKELDKKSNKRATKKKK